MSQIHPATQIKKQSQLDDGKQTIHLDCWKEGAFVSHRFFTSMKLLHYQVMGSLWMVSGPFVQTEHWNW